jgi:nucleotide-binding universal stress UspA family protein
MQAYKHILVPTDGSKLSLKAAREATALARSLKAKITAVYVIPPWMPAASDESSLMYNSAHGQSAYRKATETEAGKALAKVAAAAAAAKVSCEMLSVTDGQAWEGIIKTARAKKCDLIIMASHGRGGLAGLLLGSETQKVLSHSKTPVLVCR